MRMHADTTVGCTAGYCKGLLSAVQRGTSYVRMNNKAVRLETLYYHIHSNRRSRGPGNG